MRDLLLWMLVLGGWTAGVAFLGSKISAKFRSHMLSVLAIISLGFLLFLIFTSNPFERILPIAPEEGGDLNPLLQDFGLIIHPPLLYMGYVGLAVPFAFAIAVLISGTMEKEYIAWCRPWINIAWAFLTAGITLGSWWAYYELGWGRLVVLGSGRECLIDAMVDRYCLDAQLFSDREDGYHRNLDNSFVDSCIFSESIGNILS